MIEDNYADLIDVVALNCLVIVFCRRIDSSSRACALATLIQRSNDTTLVIQKISRLVTIDLLDLADVTCETSIQSKMLALVKEKILAECKYKLPDIFIRETKAD